MTCVAGVRRALPAASLSFVAGLLALATSGCSALLGVGELLGSGFAIVGPSSVSLGERAFYHVQYAETEQIVWVLCGDGVSFDEAAATLQMEGGSTCMMASTEPPGALSPHGLGHFEVDPEDRYAGYYTPPPSSGRRLVLGAYEVRDSGIAADDREIVIE